METLKRIDQAAADLAIGRTRLYELLASGEIRAVKIGSRGIRIPASEIDRFVAKRLAEMPAA